MKKIPFLLLTLLFLTSCLPRGLQAFCPPGLLPACTSQMIATQSNGSTTDSTTLSIYKDGLTVPYQAGLHSLTNATIYEISFNIADDLYHINGSETIRYTNNEDVPLNKIDLYLFPNILGGSMMIDNVIVNKKQVIPQYESENGILIIPLETALQPNKKLEISMGFSETIAQNVNQNYGVQAYAGNVLALAHAYLMVAVYNEEGWNDEIPSPNGDVTFSDASFYSVTVSAPETLIMAATGREAGRDAKDGRQIIHYLEGPARDFYLAASPDYQIFEKQHGEVLIRFYAPANQKDGAQSALNIAANALDDYGKRYAPYPYTELDFASTPTLALGIEYPGAIAITDRLLSSENPYLEATVAHEVGHQWFYNLVGDDQLDTPWLDESLAQFATLEYFLDQHGQAGYDAFHADLENRWARTDDQKNPIGKPVAQYSETEYVSVVYGRGPLFFEALKNKIGEGPFDSFIKDYVYSNTWKVATPDILKQNAESHCGCDLTPLFDEWVH